MSKQKTMSNSGKRKQEKGSAPNGDSQLAAGGELHQIAGGEHPCALCSLSSSRKTCAARIFRLHTSMNRYRYTSHEPGSNRRELEASQRRGQGEVGQSLKGVQS